MESLRKLSAQAPATNARLLNRPRPNRKAVATSFVRQRVKLLVSQNLIATALFTPSAAPAVCADYSSRDPHQFQIGLRLSFAHLQPRLPRWYYRLPTSLPSLPDALHRMPQTVAACIPTTDKQVAKPDVAHRKTLNVSF